jgi:hypothetical protein
METIPNNGIAGELKNVSFWIALKDFLNYCLLLPITVKELIDKYDPNGILVDLNPSKPDHYEILRNITFDYKITLTFYSPTFKNKLLDENEDEVLKSAMEGNFLFFFGRYKTIVPIVKFGNHFELITYPYLFECKNLSFRRKINHNPKISYSSRDKFEPLDTSYDSQNIVQDIISDDFDLKLDYDELLGRIVTECSNFLDNLLQKLFETDVNIIQSSMNNQITRTLKQIQNENQKMGQLGGRTARRFKLKLNEQEIKGADMCIDFLIGKLEGNFYHHRSLVRMIRRYGPMKNLLNENQLKYRMQQKREQIRSLLKFKKIIQRTEKILEKF